MDSSQQLDQVGTLFVREPMESLGARFSNEVGDVLENRPALRGEPQGMRPPVRRIEAPLHPAIGFHPVEDPHQRHGIELRQLRQTLLAHAIVVLQMQQRAALRKSERQRLRALFEPPRVATARVLEQESELAAEVHDHNGLYSITIYHIYRYHHLVLAESSPVESAHQPGLAPHARKASPLMFARRMLSSGLSCRRARLLAACAGLLAISWLAPPTALARGETAGVGVAAEPFVPTPSQLFGPLFVQIQMDALFPDGKVFPDAVPKAAPLVILQRYRTVRPRSRAALRRFMESTFSLPTEAHAPPARR